MRLATGVAIFAALVFAVLILFGLCIPYRISSAYSCPYCCAVMQKENLLLIFSSSPKISDTGMSRYWKTAVDTNHRHTWKPWFIECHMVFGDSYGCGKRWPGSWLDEKAEIAILDSLSTPLERKVFVGRLWNDWKQTGSKQIAVEKTLTEMDHAYKQNPNRKDWGKILKKLGLAP